MVTVGGWARVTCFSMRTRKSCSNRFDERVTDVQEVQEKRLLLSSSQHPPSLSDTSITTWTTERAVSTTDMLRGVDISDAGGGLRLKDKERLARR